MSTTREILDALSVPFDQKDVRTRQGGGGKQLSYIPAHLVIRRLNEACVEGWSFAILEEKWEDEVLVTRGCLTIPGLGSREGIGVQVSRANSGEDLRKASATDALKKAATLFGVAAELYDDPPPFQSPQPRPQYQQRPNAAPQAQAGRYDAPVSQPRRPAPTPMTQAVADDRDFLDDEAPAPMFAPGEVATRTKPTNAVAGGM